MKTQIYDYFIVGLGLAGTAFAEVALQNGKSFFTFDNSQKSSSEVAGGVFNPVVLKRFTLAWQAQPQMELLYEFYPKIEKRFQIKLLHNLNTLRKFASLEEQHNWTLISERPLFENLVNSEIIFRNYKSVAAPFGFGEVKNTGYLDIPLLLHTYKDFLRQNNCISEENFDYSKLHITDDFVEYQGKKARNIIFSEGFGMKSNPYFNHLPLDGAKGELLTIKTKDLDLDILLKAGRFVLPVGNDLYKVGATYDWDDKTDTPTPQAKELLLTELKEIINCDFEVVDHQAGIRPTVKDRRPLVGKHKDFRNLFILNGLGTRGVMMAPYLAQKLFDYIEFDIPLEKEINIERIKEKHLI
ncbi:MAG: FAD-dependent oxidoreductase [Flavobacteriaceae bacterium]